MGSKSSIGVKLEESAGILPQEDNTNPSVRRARENVDVLQQSATVQRPHAKVENVINTSLGSNGKHSNGKRPMPRKSEDSGGRPGESSEGGSPRLKVAKIAEASEGNTTRSCPMALEAAASLELLGMSDVFLAAHYGGTSGGPCLAPPQFQSESSLTRQAVLVEHTTAKIGFSEIPANALVKIMYILRYGCVKEDLQTDQEPTVAVAPRERRYSYTSGCYRMTMDTCRVLASTCKRYNQIFRHKFISRLTANCCTSMHFGNEFIRAYSTRYFEGVCETMKRYAAGIQSLSVFPAAVVHAHSMWVEESPEADAEWPNHWTLRNLFPQIRRVHLHFDEHFDEEIFEESKPDGSNMWPLIDQLHLHLPRDLHGFGASLDFVTANATVKSNVISALSAVIQDLKQLESLEFTDWNPERLDVSEPNLNFIARLLPEMKFENIKHLCLKGRMTLAPLDVTCGRLRELTSLEHLEVDAPVSNPRALSKSFPPSLRVLKYISQEYTVGDQLNATEDYLKHIIDLSKLRHLQDFHFDTNYAVFYSGLIYINTLRTLQETTLQKLRLTFKKSTADPQPLDPDIRSMWRDIQSLGLTRTLDKLSSLTQIHLDVPIELFPAALSTMGSLRSRPSLSFTLLGAPKVGTLSEPCIKRALGPLFTHEANAITGLGFSGAFGCAVPLVLANIGRQARALCSSFETFQFGYGGFLGGNVERGFCPQHGLRNPVTDGWGPALIEGPVPHEQRGWIWGE